MYNAPYICMAPCKCRVRYNAFPRVLPLTNRTKTQDNSSGREIFNEDNKVGMFQEEEGLRRVLSIVGRRYLGDRKRRFVPNVEESMTEGTKLAMGQREKEQGEDRIGNRGGGRGVEIQSFRQE